MRKRKVMALVLVAVLASILVFPLKAMAQGTQTHSGDFEATINQGPNAGLSLVGTLTIDVDASGEIQGLLKIKGGTRIPVTGGLTEGSIRLVLHLGDGISLFGVGALHGGISAGVTTTGIAVGPDPSDKGDWGVVWGE